MVIENSYKVFLCKTYIRTNIALPFLNQVQVGVQVRNDLYTMRTNNSQKVHKHTIIVI